jgi:hypothetical protein
LQTLDPENEAMSTLLSELQALAEQASSQLVDA